MLFQKELVIEVSKTPGAEVGFFAIATHYGHKII